MTFGRSHARLLNVFGFSRLQAVALAMCLTACPPNVKPTTCGNRDCAATEVCLADECVPAHCADQQCRASEACLARFCAAAACLAVTCAETERCVDGACFPRDCADQRCTLGQVCAEGDCVDRGCVSADGGVISCGPGQVCADGACRDIACVGTVCSSGNVCVGGACIAIACVGVQCPFGTTCATGVCLPTTCGALTCASGRVCSDGTCVDAACLGVSCPAPYVCTRGSCQSVCMPACPATGTCQGTTCYSRECGATLCAAGTLCVDGVCADAACAGVTCSAPLYCSKGLCTDGCLIQGERIADKARSPFDACLICDVTRNRTDWSPAAEGLACLDDLNDCTTDVCSGGSCRHEPLAEGSACGTAKLCSVGQCVSGCVIGGTFFPDGTVNPSNPCEVCSVAASPSAWTARAAACADDGNPCTDDVCAARACVHPVKPDATSCGAGAVCVNGSCGAQCLIAGASWSNGATNPANGCERCQSTVSTASWTPKAVNEACDTDGNDCTNDVCNGAGSCTHPPSPAGSGCATDGIDCTNDVCNGAGACTHPPTAAGVACTRSNYCILGKLYTGFQCNGSGSCGSTITRTCGTPNVCQTGGGCTGTSCNPIRPKSDGVVCAGGNGICCTGTCVPRTNNGECR